MVLISFLNIGLKDGVIFMKLSETADSIRVTGQDHRTLCLETATDTLAYHFRDEDTYARITAWFPGGEVIYTNPFARYDASVSDSPYVEAPHPVNMPLTILFNLLLLLLASADIYLIIKVLRQ